MPVGTTQDSSGTTSYYAREPLVGGENYTVTSDVSTADENTLRQVPLPVDAQAGGDYFYPQNLLNRYTEVPPDLQANQQIHQLLNDWTSGQNSMYDIAQAIETHLRSDYTYSQHNDNPPSDQDSVAWFLLQTKQGFCTYFASAMVMLARMMGMPARVASGYTNGTSDGKGHFVVKGTDAHTWAQIYFSKYGWLNFEPSAGFSSFARPVASATPTVTQTPGATTTSGANPTPINHRHTGDNGPTGSASNLAQQNDLHVRLLLGAGGLLALLILAFGATSIWWRRLFRGLSPVAQTFGRVTLLAGWAGLKPRRAQTPYEYIEELQQHLPIQAESLNRLGELYVQERWGAPEEGSGVLAGTAPGLGASARHAAARGGASPITESTDLAAPAHLQAQPWDEITVRQERVCHTRSWRKIA